MLMNKEKGKGRQRSRVLMMVGGKGRRRKRKRRRTDVQEASRCAEETGSSREEKVRRRSGSIFMESIIWLKVN